MAGINRLSHRAATTRGARKGIGTDIDAERGREWEERERERAERGERKTNNICAELVWRRNMSSSDTVRHTTRGDTVPHTNYFTNICKTSSLAKSYYNVSVTLNENFYICL